MHHVGAMVEVVCSISGSADGSASSPNSSSGLAASRGSRVVVPVVVPGRVSSIQPMGSGLAATIQLQWASIRPLACAASAAATVAASMAARAQQALLALDGALQISDIQWAQLTKAGHLAVVQVGVFASSVSRDVRSPTRPWSSPCWLRKLVLP